MSKAKPSPNDLYVCHEQPDRYNPRARGRAAVRQDIPEGQEIAVITLSGYKVGAEKSPQDWATLFAAAPDMAEALRDVEANLKHCDFDDDMCAKIRAALAKAGVV